MANSLEAFIPELWSPLIIRNFDQTNLAKMLMANTQYEGEIRQYGDTVHIRTFGNVTVRQYARGQTIVDDDLVPTREQLTIDKSFYISIVEDDLDSVQNDINALAGYSQRAGVSLSNHIDAFCFSFYSSAHANNQLSNGGSAYDISAANVYDRIVDAGLALDRQNVPAQSRWVVVTPYFKSLLLKDTTYFINGSLLGDTILTTGMVFGPGGMRPPTASEAMTAGYVGSIAGFDVWMSNALPANGSNFYCLYGQGRPLMYAAQLMPNAFESIRLEKTFGTRVRGLVLYGGKVPAETSKSLGYIYVDNS